MKVDLSKPFQVETKDDGRETLTVTIERPRPGSNMDWLVRGLNGHRPVHGAEGAMNIVTMAIYAMSQGHKEIRGGK